jgi:large subunit ribosomal protein L20
MPRATNAVASRRRRKRILNEAKGFRGRRKNLFRTAHSAVIKAWTHAYRDRKRRKREFRALWIARIAAAARLRGISYSRLIDGLTKARVEIDRKVLADLAVLDEKAFGALVEKAKEALAAA